MSHLQIRIPPLNTVVKDARHINKCMNKRSAIYRKLGSSAIVTEAAILHNMHSVHLENGMSVIVG